MTDLDTRPERPPVPEPRPQPVGERPGSPAGLIGLGALVVFAGVTGGWSLLVMIAALVVMITLHELGHYLTAKWAGMKVTEFFIGFGPKIWSVQKGETEYGVKAIPAGAYVKIIGMHNLDEFDPADADRTYMSKPYWRRLSVAVAGSTMHFILAIASLFALFAFVGVPGGDIPTTAAADDRLRETAPWVVQGVNEDTAAADAGVQDGDRIVEFAGEPVGGFESFGDLVRPRAGEDITVVVERNGELVTLQAEVGSREVDGEEQGFFGVGPELLRETLPVGEAVGETFSTFGATIGMTFEGLGQILSPSGLADLGGQVFSGDEDEGPTVASGRDGGDRVVEDSSDDGARPISIVGVTQIGSELFDQEGLFGLLFIFMTLNVFIGIFNLVPLLPLDGGHVAIATYEKIRSMFQGGRAYHVDVAKLLPLTYAVVLVLVFLGISTIYLDIADPIGG